MADRTIRVTFLGDDQLSGPAAKADASVAAFGKSASESSSKTGTAIKAAMLAGGTALVGFAALSVKTALDGQKSQAALQVAVKNAGDSYKQLAPSLQAAESAGAKFGFTNDQVRQGLVTLITATGNTKQAEQDLGITEDIAKARHMDLAAAAKLVGKVSEGNVGSLGRFGLATKDATGKTLTAAQAMAELRSKFGGMADEMAGTDAGKLDAAKAKLTDIEEEVGERILPVIANFGSDAMSAATDIEHGWDELPGPLKDIAEGLGVAVAGGLLFTKTFGAAKSVLTDVKNVVNDVTTFAGKMGERFTAAGDQIESSSDGAAASVRTIGTSSQTAAAEVESSMTDADASVASLGTASQDTAAEVTAASDEAGTAIASIGADAQAAAGEVAGASGEMAGSLATVGPAAEASGAGVAALGEESGTAAAGLASMGTEGAAAFSGMLGPIGLVAAGLVGLNTLLDHSVTKFNSASFNNESLDEAIGTGNFKPQVDAILKAHNLTSGDAFNIGFKGSLEQEVPGLSTILGDPTKEVNDQVSKAIAAAKSTIATLPAQLRPEFAKQLEAAFQTDGKTPDWVTKEVNSMLKAASAADKGKDKLLALSGAQSQAASSAKSNVAALGQQTAAGEKDAQTAQQLSQGWSDYAKQLQSVTNPVFGAINSEQQLQDAQKKTYEATVARNQAIAQYGPNSDQARQATDDLAAAESDQVTAAQGQQVALSNLESSVLAGNTSMSQLTTTLQGWVAQGLITQDEADQVTSKFNLLTISAGKVPSKVATTVTTSGADEAHTALDNVKSWIGQVPTSHLTQMEVDVSKAIAPLLGLKSLVGSIESNVTTGIGLIAQAANSVPGHAAGGLVGPGSMWQVSEVGHEVFRDKHGRNFLLPASEGAIVPHNQVEQLGRGAAAFASTNPAMAAYAVPAGPAPVESVTPDVVMPSLPDLPPAPALVAAGAPSSSSGGFEMAGSSSDVSVTLGPIEVNVTAAPGMDENALARAVARQFKEQVNDTTLGQGVVQAIINYEAHHSKRWRSPQ